VKLTIKIACALAAVAILGLWFATRHAESPDVVCDTLTLTGDISPKIFFDAKDCLERSAAKEKTFVVATSDGGDWESALALGILIHRHGWNVEVVDLCASSCANFIFPAGHKKYLHADSLLLYHGGPHQKNMLEKLQAAERAYMANPSAVREPDPHDRMEGGVRIDDQGPLRLKVREWLEVKDVSNTEDLFAKLVAASDRFYEELGVNVQLPHYGQIGRYEARYKAYELGGFIYPLDSLARLGVGNIEVKDAPWHPERNAVYHDVYEVTYP
jgi:hypothetical protein